MLKGFDEQLMILRAIVARTLATSRGVTFLAPPTFYSGSDAKIDRKLALSRFLSRNRHIIHTPPSLSDLESPQLLHLLLMAQFPSPLLAPSELNKEHTRTVHLPQNKGILFDFRFPPRTRFLQLFRAGNCEPQYNHVNKHRFVVITRDFKPIVRKNALIVLGNSVPVKA